MPSRILSSLAAAAALLAASGAFAQTPEQTPEVAPPPDWGLALREDAQAFHDLIAANHPGPVDSENPGFGARLEQARATALERARDADSYEDWYFALQEFAASFDDGHLNLGEWQGMGHVWTSDWPGFLTGLKTGEAGERHEVVFNRDPAAPPVGAVLESCDGRDADALAAEVLGRSAGRWNLASRRAVYAPSLFVDQHNPYVRRPETCTFRVAGERRDYALAWRDLPSATRDEGFEAARSPRYTTPIEMRDWAGGVWIGLGGFNGDPASADGQKLTALKAQIAEQAATVRAAPRVVFDLRGNGGGSSAWINAMAETLWGEAEIAARSPDSTAVDWRASRANLETIEGYKAVLGSNPEVLAWLTGIADGLRTAVDRGEPLWRQVDDEDDAATPTFSGPSLMTGRVFVLTDSGCASACLDAVDLLKALGAVHLGQETSADTVYMEIRQDTLPGGRVEARTPMKVYRGRARGSNETVVPVHPWTGDLSDTAGIEAWIAGL